WGCGLRMNGRGGGPAMGWPVARVRPVGTSGRAKVGAGAPSSALRELPATGHLLVWFVRRCRVYGRPGSFPAAQADSLSTSTTIHGPNTWSAYCGYRLCRASIEPGGAVSVTDAVPSALTHHRRDQSSS